jgi:hypothetical protein
VIGVENRKDYPMPSEVRERIRIEVKLLADNVFHHRGFSHIDIDRTTTAILSVIGEEIERMKRKCKCSEDAPYCICGAVDYTEALTDLRARLEK